MSDSGRVNKKRFLAKFGNTNWEHELDPKNPDPNQFLFKHIADSGATREHALKALYHPAEGNYKTSWIGVMAAKSHLVKRSDLEKFLADPNGHESVKETIRNRFKYESLAGTAKQKGLPVPHVHPYYPEDKE